MQSSVLCDHQSPKTSSSSARRLGWSLEFRNAIIHHWNVSYMLHKNEVHTRRLKSIASLNLNWHFTNINELLISKIIWNDAILFPISSFFLKFFFYQCWERLSFNSQSNSNFLVATLSILNKNLFWFLNFNMVKEIEQTKFYFSEINGNCIKIWRQCNATLE